MIRTANNRHRLVRFDDLGLQESVEKFTTKLNSGQFAALRIFARLSHHHRIANELNLGAIGIAVGAVGAAHSGTQPATGAKPRFIHLQNIGMRKMPRFAAPHLVGQRAAGIEGFDRKFREQVVWLRALGRLRQNFWR